MDGLPEDIESLPPGFMPRSSDDTKKKLLVHCRPKGPKQLIKNILYNPTITSMEQQNELINDVLDAYGLSTPRPTQSTSVSISPKDPGMTWSAPNTSFAISKESDHIAGASRPGKREACDSPSSLHINKRTVYSFCSTQPAESPLDRKSRLPIEHATPASKWLLDHTAECRTIWTQAETTSKWLSSAFELLFWLSVHPTNHGEKMPMDGLGICYLS